MMKLALDRIRRDGGTQPRVEMNLVTVAEYAEEMKNGATFPPVVVYHDGQTYWLGDGFHRYDAAYACGFQEIEADVRQGTKEDAQWFSYGANKTHGLRRSNEDKQTAVRAALSHPNAVKLNDSEIARHCGVDHKTVARYRAEMVASWEIPKIEARQVSRNGTTYTMNTAPIGRRPAVVVEPPLQEWVADDAPDSFALPEYNYAEPRVSVVMPANNYAEDAGSEVNADSAKLATPTLGGYPIGKADPEKLAYKAIQQLDWFLQTIDQAGGVDRITDCVESVWHYRKVDAWMRVIDRTLPVLSRWKDLMEGRLDCELSQNG